MWTWLECFKKWRRARKRAHLQKILPFEGSRLDDLITLVSDKKFLLFLEYLELTISEKLVMFSSIDILDDQNRNQAIRLQQQLRGLRLAIDIAEDLVNQSKSLAQQDKE